MAEIINNTISVIKQNDPDTPAYLDFEKLRREGLEHIGNLSGKIWTDHNVHDPGVTILEVLVYALMDLGYKTNLPFEDLIALQNNDDQEDNFLTPLEVLTINPVTITDYRKLLLEIRGVRNAWLEPATRQEIDLFLNANNNTLYCASDSVGLTRSSEVQKGQFGYQICLNGLYKIYIEKDSDIITNTTQLERLKLEVKEHLGQHRNLCEDFIDDIEVLTPLEVGICVEVEIHVDVNAENVYTTILQSIRNYVQPEIKYYTLEELLDKGKPIDDIFAGRPYSTNSFGFIDTEEIESFDRREKIYLSDLYDVILRIDGVRKIKNLHIKSDLGTYQDSQWEFLIPEMHVPVFSIDKTCIDIYNTQGSLSVDTSRILRAVSLSKQFEMPLENLNTNIPLGSAKEDLEDYFSIQNDFPVVYGIGEDGLPDRATLLRKTQALQLKGYLMFYDQILANYTSQLTNIRSVFSLKPESEKSSEEKKTYFTHIPDSVPGIEDILRFYNQNENALKGSRLGIPVANDLKWENVLSEIKGDPRAELTITSFCGEKRGKIDPVQFSGAGIRTIYINQLIDSFANDRYTLDVQKDRQGYFFIIKAALPDDILIISTKRYESTGEAIKEAKDMAFIASMDQSYNRITNASETNAPDLHFFDITHNTLSYLSLIQALTEDKEEYLKRRKQFLDHLLARFGEEFTDFAILQFQNKLHADQFKEHEIESQSQYVNKFAEVSRNRGKGFNYLKPSWNTGNVSGFEKRVSLLSGIENYKRRNLCNFEVTQSFRIVLKDWTGNLLFRSNNAYGTKQELQEASKKIVSQLRNPEYYSQLEKKLNGFDVCTIQRIFSEKPEKENIIVSRYYHYQQLKDSAGNPVVLSKNQKLRSKNVGLEKKEDFIKTINDQNFVSEENKDKKYRLLPLASSNRYLDVHELECDIETLISWKWHVQPDQSKKERTTCESVFNSKEDAWDHMIHEAQLDNYLTTHDIAHKWKLYVNKDVTIHALDCYPDYDKCVTAWRQAKMLGSSEKNFEVQKKEEGTVVYLKNEKGNRIAVSNVLVGNITKKQVLDCAAVFNNRKTRPEYEEEKEKFGFRLFGKDNTTVLTSYCVYDNEILALQQLDTVFTLGAVKKNYLLSGDQGNPEYSFILRDQNDSFLALAPEPYETASDRTKALNTMMRYLKSNELPVFVKEEPRRYVWSLVQNNEKILGSNTEFTSKARAQNDFDKTIIAEASKENNVFYKPYFYEFEVIATPAQYKFIYGCSDAQNKLDPVFVSTDTYNNYDQASQGYSKFVKLLPALSLKVSSENESDFGLHLAESEKSVVGAYSKGKDQLEKARNILGYITKIYDKKSNPKDSFITREIVAGQNERYDWRFYKKNAPLVTTPYRCDKAIAERIKAVICDIIPPINLKTCPKKDIVVCPEGDPNQFHYQITFKDQFNNEFVLISYVGYGTFEEAEEAWKNQWLDVISIATNPIEYDASRKINIEETYYDPNNKSCEQASFIVVIPKYIRDKVESQGKNIVTYYTELADLFPIYKTVYDSHEQQEVKYAYKVVVPQKNLIPTGCISLEDIDHIGSLLWVSEMQYDHAQEAIDAYQYFYALSSTNANCRLFCEQGKFYLGVVEVLAESAIEFDTIIDAWDDNYPNTQDQCQNCVPGGVREFVYAAEEDKNYIPVCDLNYWKFKIVSPSYFVSEHKCSYHSAKERDQQMSFWLEELESLDWDRYIFWQTDDGVSARKETEFLFRMGYGYSSEEFCSLVFAFRDGLRKCVGIEESERIETIKSSVLQHYKEDSTMSNMIQNEAFVYQDICEFVNYFPVYRTENGYRYRLYWPKNDVEITPEGLQPCGCQEITENDSLCKEMYPFVSSNEYACCSEALQAFLEFCAIIVDRSYTVECTSDTTYGPFTFEIINKQRELAYHPYQYDSLQEVKNAIDITKACVNDVGMHLLEHILMRPTANALCGDSFEVNEDGSREMIKCLLPICPDTDCHIQWQPDRDKDDPCADQDRSDIIHYIPGSDPYSFWATLVLPSWHKRFRTQEQREAFEKFLYAEVPALVGLNILWLGPRDLCDFEDAYKKWLAWKQDVSALNCYPQEHHPNCQLSEYIKTLTSESVCPTVPQGQGDCNCSDDTDSRLPSEIDGSIFWGYCPPNNQTGQEIEVSNLLVEKTTVAKKNRTATKQESKIKPIKETSKKAQRGTPKKEVTKKPAKKKEVVKKPSKNTLAAIRKRKPKYLANINTMADASMKKTKSFERTVFFIQNTPTINGYKDLVDFFAKYSLQKDNKIEGFLTLIKNATWHLLDTLTLDQKEVLKKDIVDILSTKFSELKEKGLSLKEVNNDWKSEELKEVANTKVLTQIKKLLK